MAVMTLTFERPFGVILRMSEFFVAAGIFGFAGVPLQKWYCFVQRSSVNLFWDVFPTGLALNTAQQSDDKCSAFRCSDQCSDLNTV